jgi:hypothetical protein
MTRFDLVEGGAALGSCLARPRPPTYGGDGRFDRDPVLGREVAEGRQDLSGLLDRRVGTRSAPMTSQLSPEHWHARLADPAPADAFLDDNLRAARWIRVGRYHVSYILSSAPTFHPFAPPRRQPREAADPAASDRGRGAWRLVRRQDASLQGEGSSFLAMIRDTTAHAGVVSACSRVAAEDPVQSGPPPAACLRQHVEVVDNRRDEDQGVQRQAPGDESDGPDGVGIRDSQLGGRESREPACDRTGHDQLDQQGEASDCTHGDPGILEGVGPRAGGRRPCREGVGAARLARSLAFVASVQATGAGGGARPATSAAVTLRLAILSLVLGITGVIIGMFILPGQPWVARDADAPAIFASFWAMGLLLVAFGLGNLICWLVIDRQRAGKTSRDAS